MLVFVARRLAWAVLLGFVVTLITFVIFFVLPAPSHNQQRNGFAFVPPLQAQFDARGSVPHQYLRFIGHLVRGDLGDSTTTREPVTGVIGRALPVTASLVIGGAILWLALAFPIGLLSALRPRSLLDRGLMLFVLIGVSAHPLWLGLVLSYVFGVKLHLFPIAGYCSFVYHGKSASLCGGARYWAYHMVLPWLTFAFMFAALYARMIRANVLEAMDEDYVRTARAKGAGTLRVVRRHVLRNALLPVVTMVGMDVGVAFGGALFIETVFELPGIGSLLVRSLTTGDLPTTMGVVLVVSVAVVLANLAVDLVYPLLDPRVRLRSRGDASVARLSLRRRPRAAQVPESAGVTETA